MPRVQMANRKLKFGAGVLSVVTLGVGIPVFACVWNTAKAAAPRK